MLAKPLQVVFIWFPVEPDENKSLLVLKLMCFYYISFRVYHFCFVSSLTLPPASLVTPNSTWANSQWHRTPQAGEMCRQSNSNPLITLASSSYFATSSEREVIASASTAPERLTKSARYTWLREQKKDKNIRQKCLTAVEFLTTYCETALQKYLQSFFCIYHITTSRYLIVIIRPRQSSVWLWSGR